MLLRAVSHSPVPGGGGQRSGLLPAAPRQPYGHAVQRRLLRPGHGAMAAYCNRRPAGRWIRDGLVPRPTRAEWLFGGCLSHIQNCSRDGALVLGGRSNGVVDQAILPTLVRPSRAFFTWWRYPTTRGILVWVKEEEVLRVKEGVLRAYDPKAM
jgi:hypothetical protein